MAGGNGEIINLDGRIDGGKYSTRTGELIDTDSCLQTSTSNTSWKTSKWDEGKNTVSVLVHSLLLP